MKKNKLKKINIAQFYIQLLTATIFGYMSIRDEDILKMLIAFLLILSWGLGYWRHLIVRRNHTHVLPSSGDDFCPYYYIILNTYKV